MTDLSRAMNMNFILWFYMINHDFGCLHLRNIARKVNILAKAVVKRLTELKPTV